MTNNVKKFVAENMHDYDDFDEYSPTVIIAHKKPYMAYSGGIKIKTKDSYAVFVWRKVWRNRELAKHEWIWAGQYNDKDTAYARAKEF